MKMINLTKFFGRFQRKVINLTDFYRRISGNENDLTQLSRRLASFWRRFWDEFNGLKENVLTKSISQFGEIF